MASKPRSPSLRATIRARQALLFSWVTTAPFVTSHLEDERKGTAKETRQNTLRNRFGEYPAEKVAPKKRLRSSPTSSSASDSSEEEVKSVTFSDTVSVYYADRPGEKKVQRVRFTSGKPMMRRKVIMDPRLPVSVGGKWLLRKTTNDLAEDQSQTVSSQGQG